MNTLELLNTDPHDLSETNFFSDPTTNDTNGWLITVTRSLRTCMLYRRNMAELGKEHLIFCVGKQGIMRSLLEYSCAFLYLYVLLGAQRMVFTHTSRFIVIIHQVGK